MTIKQAVVLAAGEGKRLRPLTFSRPKCMIHLAGKPILAHVLDNLAAVGVTEAGVVVKYQKEKVLDYFKKHPVDGLHLSFVEQGEKYGTGAAFLDAEGLISDTFFGVAGDVITEPSALDEIARTHDEKKPLVTAGLKRVDDAREYGTAVLDAKGLIKGFAEKSDKPASDLANASLYAMEPNVFAHLRELKKSPRGEYEFVDVLTNGKCVGAPFSEYWLDMGLPWQLFNANEFLLGRLSELVGKGKVENSTVAPGSRIILEDGAVVHDSYLEGLIYIGAGTTVGPHAYIRGTTSIGAKCDIGDSTTVKNSIIFDKVNAKHLAYIGDSIVGEGCNFGAATQIANYRFDAGSIKAQVNEVVVDTRRNKLGAIIGDNTKFGVLSSVMPGKMVGDECWIDAGVVVKENVDRKTWVQLQQKLMFKKKK